MSVWPLVLSLVAGVLVIGALAAVFVGSERLTRRLTRGRLSERDDTGGPGGGEMTGLQGLISRGEGEDLYPRDRDR
ncbi:MAG: hypothetical protein JWM71_354 [Solirubrobacteraceae bacterium]|nr:hypothetical protein [Solirubrobacteraceae bacterium]